MHRKLRCMSKWNKIIVVDDNKQLCKTFDLNELGQLKDKLKTQNRRKIHEGRQARRKTQDHSKASISKVNDEINNQRQTFDQDGFYGHANSMLEIFQGFSDISSVDINNIDINNIDINNIDSNNVDTNNIDINNIDMNSIDINNNDFNLNVSNNEDEEYFFDDMFIGETYLF